MNIDYVVCQALNYRTQGLPGAINLYDVSCKWIQNSHDPVNAGEYLSLPQFKQFIAAVGKFHMSAHIKKCFALFSPNFIKGIGQVDGEILEMLWAALNLISKSARTMTIGARCELLDDHMRDWNWKKLVGMGKSS
jgi:hypothetical protein